MSKQQMFASIVGALGGRAAEETVWGKSEVTTGAAGDLQQVRAARCIDMCRRTWLWSGVPIPEPDPGSPMPLPVHFLLPPPHLPTHTHTQTHAPQVTRLARAMVTRYGFSALGPCSMDDDAAHSPDVVTRLLARRGASEAQLRAVDAAVRALAAEAYDLALAHVRDHRAALDEVASLLLEKETMTGDEFRAVLARHGAAAAERSEDASRGSDAGAASDGCAA